MKAILHVAVVTLRQAAHRTWTWLPVALLAVYLFASARKGMSVWPAFYRSAAVPFIYMLFSLVTCSGLVADEVASGRVLMLHPLGLSRTYFLFGRLFGSIGFCIVGIALPHLVLALYLKSQSSVFEWRSPAFTLLFGSLFFLYYNTLLTFLSTIIPSWGNSVVALSLNFFAGSAADAFAPQISRIGPNFMNYVRLLLGGPLKFLLLASQSTWPPAKDVSLVFGATFLLLFAASITYGRKQVGTRLGRD